MSGEAYESYIQRHIFAPLAMEHAYAWLAEARLHDVASGYYPYFGQVRSQDAALFSGGRPRPPPGWWPAPKTSPTGSSPISNGALWGCAVGLADGHGPAAHGRGVDHRRGGLRHGLDNLPFTDALPAGAVDQSAPLALTHGGRWLGYAGQLLLLPEQELGVVLLMNLNDPAIDSGAEQHRLERGAAGARAAGQGVSQHEDWLLRNARWLMFAAIVLFAAPISGCCGGRQN